MFYCPLRSLSARSFGERIRDKIAASKKKGMWMGGVPLFVEELTKTVLESGLLIERPRGWHLDGPLPPFAIPATLQDSLAARLDRLAPVKEIAQIGAAIGREFSYPLLRAVAGRDEPALRAALAQLEEAELLFRSGMPPDARYTFKRALVQDTPFAIQPACLGNRSSRRPTPPGC